MNIKDEAAKMKQAAPLLASAGEDTRNTALLAMIEKLEAGKEKIFAANAADLSAAKAAGLPAAIVKRLKFDESKLEDSVSGIRQLISLPDPIGKVTLARELDEGLRLYRVTCPIGVIAMIFEARPDAMIQISSLAVKSGNCAILKGGKETKETNRAIFSLLHEAITAAGLPPAALLQAEQHSEIDELLACHDDVDLIIPRGSNAFVQYIMNHTNIPVMGHADGICHIYVDKDYDIEKALPIVIDAKTQYTAACNATETLLVHRSIAKDFLPKLEKAVKEKNVQLRGTKEVGQIISVEPISDVDFHHEYLDLVLAVKLVENAGEAIDHINHYGSHHTDAIITENINTAARFMQLVDSAGVYQNASTRFADGFRYGFGAEVGISTGKLHARGPVGLEGLLSYKYKLFGKGHIVEDYAVHKKEFHFKNL